MRLLRHIRLDDLVRDVAAAATKVAPRPDMAAPKSLAQVRKLAEPALGAFALQPLDEATAGNVRRDREHDMDMIWGEMPLQHIDARLLTRCPDDGPDPFCALPT